MSEQRVTHDPGLVERVAQQMCSGDSEGGMEDWSVWRGFWVSATERGMDLLAAEGRLCEPGEDNRRWGE